MKKSLFFVACISAIFMLAGCSSGGSSDDTPKVGVPEFNGFVITKNDVDYIDSTEFDDLEEIRNIKMYPSGSKPKEHPEMETYAFVFRFEDTEKDVVKLVYSTDNFKTKEEIELEQIYESQITRSRGWYWTGSNPGPVTFQLYLEDEKGQKSNILRYNFTLVATPLN